MPNDGWALIDETPESADGWTLIDEKPRKPLTAGQAASELDRLSTVRPRVPYQRNAPARPFYDRPVPEQPFERQKRYAPPMAKPPNPIMEAPDMDLVGAYKRSISASGAEGLPDADWTPEMRQGAREAADIVLAPVTKIPFVPTQTPGVGLEMKSLEELRKQYPQDVVTGALHGAGRVAEGLTTPRNVMILEAMMVAPPIAQAIASGYFTAEMAKAAIEQSPEALRAAEEGRWGDLAQNVTQMAASGYLAGKAGEHALKGGRAAWEQATGGLGMDGARFANETRAIERAAEQGDVPLRVPSARVESIDRARGAAEPPQGPMFPYPKLDRQVAMERLFEEKLEAPKSDGWKLIDEPQKAPESATLPVEEFARGQRASEPARPDPGRQTDAVQRPVRASRSAHYGNPTAVEIPGESTSYPARYQVRELDEVFPSHNALNFEPNPDYFYKNDRNYSDPVNQERVVKWSQQGPEGFKSSRLLTDNPTATNGPTVIDPEGNALGGNNRAMILRRVYEMNPAGAAEYRDALIARAFQFGLDPQAVANMKRPVLLREVEASALVDRAQRAITDFNKKETAELTAAERATADARTLDDSALEYLQGVIESAGPNATLNDALSGRNGPPVLNALVDAGVFTAQEKPILIDPRSGELTAGAKERISKMLLGRLFRDSAQYQRTMPELRNKLERIVSPISQVRARSDWDITGAVQDAVDILEYARAHGIKNLPDLERQAGFGEMPNITPQALAIAGKLQDNPLNVSRAFKQYASEAALSDPSRPMSMFGTPEPAESFRSAFDRNPERGAITLNPAAIRASAQKAWETLNEKATTGRKHWTDEYAFIENLTRELRESGALKADEDPYIMARIFAGTGGKIEGRIDQELAPIYRQARKLGMDDVRNYALLDRYEELANRGITEFPDGKTPADLAAEKAALEARLNAGGKLADVRATTKALTDYSQRMLEAVKDAGIISDAAYQAIRANNEKYVPLQRLEYIEKQVDGRIDSQSDAMSVPTQDLVRSIEGSQKAVADPLESIIRNTYRAETLIARNQVAQSMAELSNRPEFAGIVNLLKPNQAPQAGYESFAYLKDGQKQTFEAPADIVDALKRVDKHSADIVTRMFSKSAAMLRAGATTLNVPFALYRNPIRDVQSAYIISKAAGASPVEFAKYWGRGFAAAIGRTKEYDDYLRSGAAISGGFESMRTLPTKVKQVSRSRAEKVARTIVNPVELVRLAGETFELAPRIGTYLQGKERGLSTVEAAYNARNATVDFQKAGTAGRLVNQWVPFLNARLQGTINLRTSLRDRPGQTALRLGLSVLAPGLATYFNNVTNHKDVWDDIPDFEKEANFLLIYGDEKDDKGRYSQVVKIPKGEAGQIAWNTVEGFLEWLYSKNPKTWQQIAMEAASNTSPIGFERDGKFDAGKIASTTLPPTAKGVIEGVTNTNFYTGRPIVPQKMQGASPEQQYRADTPKSVVSIGKATGISPMKIQNFLATQFGGVGRQAAQIDTSKPYMGLPQVFRTMTESGAGARGGAQEQRQFEALKEAKRKNADVTVERDRQIEQLLKEIKAAKDDGEAAAKLDAFMSSLPSDEDRAAAEKALVRLADKVETPAFERSIENEPLAVRARYFIDELRKAKLEEQEALMKKWAEQGILTDKVLEAMERLAEQ
jgi:hypothetical protein